MTPDPATPALPTTINLAGLPEQVVRSIRHLVDSVRETLPAEALPPPQRPPLRGRFADLKLSVPADAIEEARREAGANFPRDFPEAGDA